MPNSSSSETPVSPRLASGMMSPRTMRSRTQSISSDKPSTIAQSFMSAPTAVSPEAIFIASAAASQIVTNDHDSHADTWYDQQGIEPAGETALVSNPALQLVNNFLDQLLFNFLQCAKATTLAALRPAVTEVLKPKLAKDAIHNADEELREYLGGGDEDDFVQPHGAHSRDWDLELVWKRTRLRCMVYSSLGDLEEEDEDLYMEQENLEIGTDEQISAVISPAVAIFLTSVLEYMGELTLTVAGQAAHNRMRTKFEKELQDGTRTLADIADRLVVEDYDTERVALDRTLGRLWRGWKKRLRTPTTLDLNSRPFSRSSGEPTTPRLHLTESNTGDLETVPEPIEEPATTEVDPCEVPLPMGERDVDEIEVPGLATHSDDDDDNNDDDDDEKEELDSWRPRSLLVTSALVKGGLLTPAASPSPSRSRAAPVLLSRKRSNSLPTPGALPFYPAPKRTKQSVASPTEEDQNDQDAGQGSDQASKEEPSHEPSDVSAKDSETNVHAITAEEATEDQQPPSNSVSKITATAAGAVAAVSATVMALAHGRAPETETETSEYTEGDSEADRTTADEKQSVSKHAMPRQNGVPFEEMNPYEAEIMTSARVSVAGTPTAEQENPHASLLSRSSSVRSSARIVDIGSPKSPTRSRSPEQESQGHVSKSSLGRGFSSEISRSSLSNHTISERDEKDVREAAVESATSSTSAAPRLHQRPSPVETSQPPAHRTTAKHIPISSKMNTTALNGDDYAISDERPPEVPLKALGRPMVKTEGLVGLERARTKESDEDTALPISPRQIHTSTSSHSSGTGRLHALRTSEEPDPMHAENVARNFEELIQSNQTITYTLTPENMRDIDPKSPGLDSPVMTKFSRKSEDSRVHNRSTSGEPRRPSSSKNPVLASPLKETFPSSPLRDTFSGTSTGPDRAPNGRRSSRVASAGPREARVADSSTADFANFIKSTGPAKDNSPSPLRNLSLSNPSAAAPISPPASVASGRVSASGRHGRYQPREASGDSRVGNSDLIDFIRQGPPGGANGHRIPRHVAPFRDQRDSDEMSGMAPNKSHDDSASDMRPSRAPTNATETSRPSVHSSIDSKTDLLRNRAGTHSHGNGTMYSGTGDRQPVRKSRAPRDPYELDLSDDDDDELLFEVVKPAAKREESLAEFLRDYQPPPEPKPLAAAKPQGTPRKKASAPSLMGRFTRGASKETSSRKPSTPPVVTPVAPTETRSLSSRVGTHKKYIPLQVNIPAGGGDSYTLPGDSFSRPRVRSAAGVPPARAPMRKFEPRDAVPNSDRTTDLATFLRDSAPPPPGPTAPLVVNSTQPETTGSLSKMFGRRRK